MLKQGSDPGRTKESPSRGAPKAISLEPEALSNPETLETIYHDFFEELCAHALSILHSKERAEDAIQGAFARTLAALEQGTRINDVERWLHRCVYNACMDELRVPKTEDEAELEEMPGAQDPAEVTDWRDRCRIVYGAVGDLPSHLRMAFLLSEVRGLTYDEVADEMGRSVESVRHLIFRARRHLREMVGDRATGLAMPSASIWGQEHPLAGLARSAAEPGRSRMGLMERIHEFLLSNAGRVRAHFTTLVERTAQVMCNPALPVAVSALIVGGVVHGESYGSAESDTVVAQEGVDKAAFIQGLSSGESADSATDSASDGVGQTAPVPSEQEGGAKTPEDGSSGEGGADSSDGRAGLGDGEQPAGSAGSSSGEEGGDPEDADSGGNTVVTKHPTGGGGSSGDEGQAQPPIIAPIPDEPASGTTATSAAGTGGQSGGSGDELTTEVPPSTEPAPVDDSSGEDGEAVDVTSDTSGSEAAPDSEDEGEDASPASEMPASIVHLWAPSG